MLTLSIKLNGQAGFSDFTGFLYGGGGGPVMSKKHALNSLPVLTFVLKEASGFVAPDLHNEVRVDCGTYAPSGEWFTGFIADYPQKAIFAQETDGTVRVLWTVNCASETYLCDQRAPLYFGNMVPFQNQTVGQILKYLLNLLAPGRFDVSNVDDGPTVPLYAPLSTDSFMTVVKNLAESSGMKFWTRRGKAFLKYFNDADMGFALNQTDATFNADEITVTPQASPVINDVLGYGDEEPGVYVREYFAGDGLSMQFPLGHTVAGLVKQVILQDDFTNTGIDSTKWNKSDPTNAIQQGPSLYFASGAGLNSTKLVAVQSLEMAGTTLVQHGIVRFTAPSSGIVGGLYSAGPSTHVLSSCLLGFQCSVSGSQTLIQPILAGVISTGTGVIGQGGFSSDFFVSGFYLKGAVFSGYAGPLLTVSGMDYIFQTYFQAPQRVRQLRTFGCLSIPTGFSTPQPSSSMWASLRVLVLSESDYSAVPTSVEIFNGTVSGAPAFTSYAPFNSDNLNLATNFLSVSHPPDVIGMTLPGPKAADTRVRTYTVGDSKEVDKDATVLAGTQGQSPATFSLFGIVAPSAGDQVEVRYRSAAQMAARITNPSSIALEASRMGDDGRRAMVLPQLGFSPRNSSELELAIKAYLADHSSTVYQGQWTYNTWKYAASGVSAEPIPGRFFTVNVSSQYPSFSAFCNEVDADIMVESTSPSGAEVISYTIKFGNLIRFDALIGELGLQDLNTPEAVGLPGFDTTIPPSTDFNSVATSYAFAPDIPDFQYAYTRTSSTYQVSFGTTPPTSVGGDVGHFEVRYSDSSWSIPASLNLISEVTGSTATLGRSSRTQQYYAKAVVPANLATHSCFEDGVNYLSASGTNPPTGSWDGTVGAGSLGSIKVAFPVGSVACSGSFTNANLTALPSGLTTASRFKFRATRALTGTEELRFKLLGTFAPTSEAILTSGQVTSSNFSFFQDFTIGPTTVTPTGATSARLTFYVKSAINSALTGWVDDVQVEKAPGVTVSPFYKTTVLPKGPSSRYPSLVQLNFPLVPPSPTGIILDGTKALKPSMTTPLPSGPFTDVFGLRVADGSSAIYDYSEPGGSLGITFNDPGLVFVYDNSVLKARSKAFGFSFYNALGEVSPITTFTMLLPTGTVTGVGIDEVGQAVTWAPNPTAMQYEAHVSPTSDFSVLSASGTLFGLSLRIPVDSVVNQRFYRVRMDDGLGFGGYTTGFHSYSPFGVLSFDNSNNVKSVGFPASPSADPVYPSAFSPYSPLMVAQAWDDYARESTRYNKT